MDTMIHYGIYGEICLGYGFPDVGYRLVTIAFRGIKAPLCYMSSQFRGVRANTRTVIDKNIPGFPHSTDKIGRPKRNPK
jgi:hypothetical protein